VEILDQLKFDSDGLIPAVVQDAENGEVLMVAWMNRDSVEKTITSGNTCFWSRSRQKFWIKGETSGHFQKVKEIRFDCDKDCLLVKVEQIGAACHDGYRSCFYRTIAAGTGEVEVSGDLVVNPEDVYGKK
jgi:phosphoribosyl-AMP cyclohydrolase